MSINKKKLFTSSFKNILKNSKTHSVNRVTLPVILNSPAPALTVSEPSATPTPPSKKQKNKTSGGIFGFLKSSSMSPEPQQQNNLATGKEVFMIFWN